MGILNQRWVSEALRGDSRLSGEGGLLVRSLKLSLVTSEAIGQVYRAYMSQGLSKQYRGLLEHTGDSISALNAKGRLIDPEGL